MRLHRTIEDLTFSHSAVDRTATVAARTAEWTSDVTGDLARIRIPPARDSLSEVTDRDFAGPTDVS